MSKKIVFIFNNKEINFDKNGKLNFVVDKTGSDLARTNFKKKFECSSCDFVSSKTKKCGSKSHKHSENAYCKKCRVKCICGTIYCDLCRLNLKICKKCDKNICEDCYVTQYNMCSDCYTNSSCELCSSYVSNTCHIDVSYVPQCNCCVDTILCRGCIENCETCEYVGCDGCGNINNCCECYKKMCFECMGQIYCKECGNAYYCDDCLIKGKCPNCI
jgi:hypothetical protein